VTRRGARIAQIEEEIALPLISTRSSRAGSSSRGLSDRAWAERYLQLSGRVRTRETALGATRRPGADWRWHGASSSSPYKDEYEVARFYTDGQFEAQIADQSTAFTSAFTWHHRSWRYATR
jgi:hypothetical protein